MKKRMKEIGIAVMKAGRKYAAPALAVALVAAPALLFGQDPPGALTEFDITDIRSAAAPVVNDVVKALAGIFGLLFSIVILKFAWKYVRGAFGR